MAQGTTRGVPIDIDPLLTADSDLLVPSQKAVKSYAQPKLSGTGLVKSVAGTISYLTDNSANWDTAYSDRLKWDGGSSGLVAATGRTSLGANTVGSNLFTLTNPSAITFIRINADNSVSTLDAATFRTAIGAISNIYKDAVPSSAVTGTTAVTILKSYLITGGTYSANDVIDLPSFKVKKTGTAGTFTQRIYLNTSNTLSGAVVIATFTSSSGAIVNSKMLRTFTLNGGNLEGYPFTTADLNSDIASRSVAYQTTPLNPANDFYLITTIQLANGADSVVQTEFLLR